MKSLYEYSWKVDEPTYRADPAISQSLINDYIRDGYNALISKESKQTSSLLFGSIVDCILTEGLLAFQKKYIAEPDVDIPSNNVLEVLKVAQSYGTKSLGELSKDAVVNLCNIAGYGKSYKEDTKVTNILKYKDYYTFMLEAEGKTIISSKMYSDAFATTQELKKTGYFSKHKGYDHYFQLKFKKEIQGVVYRGMLDLVVVSHESKTIYPIDLKTSSSPEYDFYKSFIKWGYDIQARLYWWLLHESLKDTEYKDYKIADYRFLVCNKDYLMPLVWEFENTSTLGDIIIITNNNNKIVLKDPFTIGKKMVESMQKDVRCPVGINLKSTNSIKNWIKNEL